MDRIRENAGAVVSRCKARGISVAGVTKGICGHPSVAQVMLEAGCKWVADSRLKNIQLMREAGVKGPFMLLRIPMACEIDCAVDLASATLVSTVEAIELLERSCAAKRKSHGVIVMIDVGDLREGILPCEVEGIGKSLKGCRWVTPLGVGTNVGCYGGVLPSPDNIGELVQVGHDLEGVLGCKLEFFSGGSTSSLRLLEKGELPEDVNQLRIGEAILLGRDVTHGQVIPYLRQDTMMFEAQVIEVRSKPSAPKGELGADAFGNAP
ncbi:MAG TPA: alanine racemase, partial [Thermosynergistes sp.]|nr:alanine racemase [Thermosynergistes sp.]